MPQLTWRWAPGWEGWLETRSHLISLFVTHIQVWRGENKEGEVCITEEWSLGFTIKKEESLKARTGGIQCLAARQIFLCPKWRSLFLTRKLLSLVCFSSLGLWAAVSLQCPGYTLQFCQRWRSRGQPVEPAAFLNPWASLVSLSASWKLKPEEHSKARARKSAGNGWIVPCLPQEESQSPWRSPQRLADLGMGMWPRAGRGWKPGLGYGQSLQLFSVQHCQKTPQRGSEPAVIPSKAFPWGKGLSPWLPLLGGTKRPWHRVLKNHCQVIN